MLPDMIRIALVGGVLAADRGAGWSFMLSQPLVGACLAGALLNPGPEWELWSLRVPIGVGALLQLLLTDASLPAAQRRHDTATAGVVGSTVALLGMVRLHEALPGSVGGALWVVVGVVAGLLSAVVGGWVLRFHGSRSASDVARAQALAEAGDDRGFERLYWRGLLRVFSVGALWSWAASVAGLGLALAILPRAGSFLTGPRVGVLLAVLLGAGLASAYHAHVRGRPAGARWAALGAAVAVVLTIALGRGAP